MNFDDLKNEWADDISKDVPLDTKKVPLDKTRSTIDRLKINMRREFFGLGLSYFFIFLAFFILSKPYLSFLIGGTACLILLMQTIYFCYHCYIFYKQLERSDLSLRKNIRKIAYDLELNIERYKTYSFCSMPIGILTCVAYLNTDRVGQLLKQTFYAGSIVQIKPLLITGIIIIFAQLLSYYLSKMHINWQYGRYLRELKQVMNDLEEDN
ncbi:hypothetical protein [Pinibacter aurantiacus]|uniref:Uncharacterized protein n=1 Tax=Pinibacter aurantiacus TaxID=2851599 RepID=A0A9E2SD34_9BACT|nr:hypothetical protein [Pinibacter aurantiacus]MBV4358280.1 hypothetical protein [Pinibacter aurantiacus]